ncbi:AAA family ATPase [Piscirickettsia salmonis]|uniref:AAA family ATPase n=1 Tax=Piscirickettsia salmonis TaxID=1238 RepID=UPI00030CA82B|nr:AAA family ATPase [Piscirickettsia salmonis]APS58056.1 zeta toxin family protein [Piscirickettsia salmonis]ERL60751.1 AAA domain protein [Piscirickettsia salmonis LF-89 = ATCC VR-1361]PEQ14885.1 zeta toxin family protein [Piscirickettsia salmonis]QGN76349.1 putative kinase [Piscirickettsia salmonis]QGN79936.1 putative kinase [Piscirickettsia salmonis]
MAQPQLWVIAGPNGSGKTTLAQRYFKDKLPVVNPDEIAKELDPNDPHQLKTATKAGKLAAKQRKDYLDQSKNFAFETTFSGKGELVLMQKAADAGFKVNLVFISTDSPTISRGRIRQRVSEGGHHIPSQDVIRRYHRSLINLPKGLSIADRSFILDNSRSRLRLLLSRENSKVKSLSKSLPQWLKGVNLGFELKKGLQR